MTFLKIIFDRLQKAASAPVIREVRGGKVISVAGSELLAMVQQARQFLVARGLKQGDRCALLAPLYWVLMSIGAWVGLVSLIRNPFYWAKTEHGVSLSDTSAHPPAFTLNGTHVERPPNGQTSGVQRPMVEDSVR